MSFYVSGILTSIKKENDEKSEEGTDITMSFPSGHDSDGLHYRVQGTFTRWDIILIHKFPVTCYKSIFDLTSYFVYYTRIKIKIFQNTKHWFCIFPHQWTNAIKMKTCGNLKAAYKLLQQKQSLCFYIANQNIIY